ncbi:hypothetical protein SRHO_G00282850 [Serrasalmus rhombeus]
MDQPPPSEGNNAGNSLIPGGHPNQSGDCQSQSYGALYGQPHEGQSPGLSAHQPTNPGEKSVMDQPPPYPGDTAGNTFNPRGYPQVQPFRAPYFQPHEGQSPVLYAGQHTNPGEKSAMDLPPPFPVDNAGNSPIPGGYPIQSGYPQGQPYGAMFGQPHEGKSRGLCAGQPTVQPTVYVTTVTTTQPLLNTLCCCLPQGAAALFFPIRLVCQTENTT